MQFVIEYRDAERHKPFGAWTEIVPGVRYTREDVVEFNETLTHDDFRFCSTRSQWRARLLPEYGYEIIELWGPAKPSFEIDETEPPLARDMPASVHRLNEQILSAIGC